ncbi:MAG: alpha/beta hydrolase [Desulfobacterales bacterium]|jgi:pimeloyl-ACP methyl ester carboxylesterase
MNSTPETAFPTDSENKREPTEHYLNLTDGRIHYLDWGGSGLPAHFLHGNGFCAGTYTPFIRYLVDDLHILASDVRGHGGSDRPGVDRIRHWDIFAEDLKNLIEQKMSAPVIGIGHSLGAVTTYIAAAQYPHLFSAIVLIDPVILPHRQLWLLVVLRLLGLRGILPLAKMARRRRREFKGKQEALRLFAAGRGIFKNWSKEFVQAYLECGLLEKDEKTAVLRCDPELEAQIFESIPLNVWRYAQKIRCPVLAIRGELSDIFATDAAQRLKGCIADYELQTVSHTGHFPSMEKPEESAHLILDFINRRLDPR